MDFITASQTAERCQRNWDRSAPVSQEDIETIIKTATTMPTKQNVRYYNLVVSTNQEFNDVVHDSAMDSSVDSFKNTKRDKWRNAQVSAPLLLLYYPRSASLTELQEINPTDPESVHRDNTNISIGISSGAASLTASYLGYKTGFCSCIEVQLLNKNVKEKFTDQRILDLTQAICDSEDIVGLGIGHPDSNFDRRVVVKDGEDILHVNSFDKTISVDYIK